MSDENKTVSRGDLSFSLRHGYEDLPKAMRLEELSNDLRREIWNEVRRLLLFHTRRAASGPYFSSSGRRLIECVLGRFAKLPEDEVPTNFRRASDYCKEIVIESRFNRVLDLLEIMIDEQGIGSPFQHAIDELFKKHVAAYQLDSSGSNCQFLPSSSGEQGDSIQQALETLREGNMDGATTHLQEAAGHINARRFADSIRDSIHAVESAARVLSPKNSKTLTPALNSLEKAGVLKHPTLKSAFVKLYGYTSNEEGIRHPLLESGVADVGLEEALFMFGACASFASYLTEKHRQGTQN